MLKSAKIRKSTAYTAKTVRPGPLLLLMVLGLLSLTPAAFAQPFAEVGVVLSDGTLQLHTWKFQSEISNGLPVQEITSEISNGLAHVVLRAEDGCHTVSIPLRNENGLMLAGSSWPPGSVFVAQLDPSPVLGECEDNGCSAFADEPWKEWSCGRSGPWACACEVIVGGDQVSVYGPAYCMWSIFRLQHWQLQDFIRPEFIES